MEKTKKMNRFFSLIATLCFVVSCAFIFSACDDKVDLSKGSITLQYTTTAYDGTEKKPTITVKYDEDIIDAGHYIVTYTNNINVGSATVNITAKENDAEVTGTASINFTITKATNSFTTALAISDWTFGGTASTPTATARFGAPTFTYSDSANGTFTSTVPTAVGKYYVKASVAGTNNYDAISATEEFNISLGSNAFTSQLSMSKTAWTFGTDQIGAPSATASHGTVFYKYANSVNGVAGEFNMTTQPTGAGEYWVKAFVLATNEYIGIESTPVKFTISQADNSLTTALTMEGWTFNQTAKNPSAVALNGDVTFTYSTEEDGTYTSTKPTDAGTYFVKANVAESTNYKAFTSTAVSFTIEKATVTAPIITAKTYTGNPLTADITDSAQYTVTTNAGGTDAGEYDVVLTLTTPKNYKWSDVATATKTLKFNITQATNSFSQGVAITGWTFDETANQPSAVALFGDIVYTYSTSENGTYTEEVPSDAGEYWVKASVIQTNNYEGVTSGPVSFTIEKATVTAPIITAKTYTGNPLTADITDSAQYTVTTNAGGTDAGEYDVVLTLTTPKNYKWSDVATATKTLKFNITQATNAIISNVAITGWAYGTTPNTPTFNAKFGNNTISYTYSASENGTYTEEVPDVIGTIWVKATIAQTNNYAGITDKTSFEITFNENAITNEKQLVKSIALGNTTIELENSIVVANDLTIPAGVEIVCDNGITLTTAESKTITINGKVTAFANSREQIITATTFANYIKLNGDITSPQGATSDKFDLNFANNATLTIDTQSHDIAVPFYIRGFTGANYYNVNLTILNSLYNENDDNTVSTIGSNLGAYGLMVRGNSAINVTVRDMNIVGKDGGIYTNGKDTIGTLTLNHLMLTGEEMGAYFAAKGTYNITNCMFSGATAFYAKSGTHTVTNSMFNATASVYTEPTYNSNGANGTGSAIVLDSASGYLDPLRFAIANSSINSISGYGIEEIMTSINGITINDYTEVTVSNNNGFNTFMTKISLIVTASSEEGLNNVLTEFNTLSAIYGIQMSVRLTQSILLQNNLELPDGLTVICVGGVSLTAIEGTEITGDGIILATITTAEDLEQAINFANYAILLNDITNGETYSNIDLEFNTDTDFILDLNGFNIEKKINVFNYEKLNTAVTYDVNFGIINEMYSGSDEVAENSLIGITNNGSCDYGIVVWGDEKLVVGLENIFATGYWCGLGSNGTMEGATIYAENSTFISGNADLAVYLPADYNYNFINCTFKGATAYYTKSGVHNILGCTFIADGARVAPTYNGNGANPTGSAIVVDSATSYKRPMTVTITNSSIESTNGYGIEECVTAKQGANLIDYATVTQINNSFTNCPMGEALILLTEVATESALREAITSGYGSEIILTANIELTSNLTIPSDFEIICKEGVSLTVRDGVALTNHGKITSLVSTFEQIQTAITFADYIKLTAEITTGASYSNLNLYILSNKTLTIDLNGFNIKSRIFLTNADYSLAENARTYYQVKVTVTDSSEEHTGVLGDATNPNCYYGMTIRGNNLFSVTLRDITAISYYGGITTIGTDADVSTNAGASISIFNCHFEGVNTEDSIGVYFPGNHTYYATESYFKGATAYYAKSGFHTIMDCEFVTTKTQYSAPVHHGNGANVTGSAIVVDSATGGYGNSLNLCISNSQITSLAGYGIEECVTASAGLVGSDYAIVTQSENTFNAAKGNLLLIDVNLNHSLETSVNSSLTFLTNNVYNKLSDQSRNTVAQLNEKLSLTTPYYIEVATLGDINVSSIALGDATFSSEDNFSLSIGKNSFIVDKAFYVEGNKLYIASVILNFEGISATKIKINNINYDFYGIMPQGPAMFSSIDFKSGTNTVERTAGGAYNEYTVTINEGNTLLRFFINGANPSTIVLTKKSYDNTFATSYGFTTVESEEGNPLGLYPVGWVTDMSTINANYKDNILYYNVYVVGVGTISVILHFNIPSLN